MKIVFAGTIGQSGLGGQVWATLQYLLGLRALGHEVVYLEDCGPESQVARPVANAPAENATAPDAAMTIDLNFMCVLLRD